MTLFEVCGECGGPCTDTEYVVNWGTCNACFDRHYEEYLASKENEESS